MAYSGQVFPIPVGQGGLVGTKNQGQIAPDKLIVARNISMYGLTLSKEGGAAKYNSSAITGAPQITGGWDWFPTPGVQRCIVFTDAGKILRDDGTGTFPTTLKSGLSTSTTQVPVFVEGGKEVAANNRKLVIFSATNKPQVLSGDGVTTSDLATPPADWSGVNQPTFGFIHEGRLWAGGNPNDPYRLYYSTTTNHEDFTGGSGATASGSLTIYPGQAERLTGAMSFKGGVIAWKFPVGIYLVDTTDPTIANWKIKKLSEYVGGVSPLGHCITDNDVIFMDPTANIHLLSAVNDYGSISASNLARTNMFYTFLQDNLGLGQLGLVRAVYYDAKREVHFACAGAGATKNTVRVKVDFNHEQQVRFSYSDRDTCQSLWLRRDANNVPRLTSGDDAGFVWNMDQTTKSKAGVGYSGAFQTPYMDFSWIDPKLATVRKIGQFLECVVAPTGNWNLSVDILWDGTTVQTVTFNMGVTGAILGAFVLGTDKLAGDQILNRKRRIVGSGRRLSLAGVNSGAGEDFSVAQFLLHCLIGDERLGRDTL